MEFYLAEASRKNSVTQGFDTITRLVKAEDAVEALEKAQKHFAEQYDDIYPANVEILETIE